MPDILHEVVIEKQPDDIFTALTNADEVAHWWTNQATIPDEVGEVAEFTFEGGAMVFKFEQTALDAGKKVHWAVVDGGPPDWAGTRVTWDLTQVDNGTKVLLGHRDYKTTEGSFAAISYSWAYYLTSLKSYLETGTGMPFEN